MTMRRISNALLILLFLTALFGSLFQLSIGEDITRSAAGCPLMLQQETICSMGASEHISAWQSQFVAIVSPIVQLGIIFATLLFLGGGSLLPPRLPTDGGVAISVIFQYLREKLYAFCIRPLQELFACGILHPKLF